LPYHFSVNVYSSNIEGADVTPISVSTRADGTDIFAFDHARKQIGRFCTVWLFPFRRINAIEADFMLLLRIIQQRDGIAIGYVDDFTYPLIRRDMSRQGEGE
jgi:hypothetical protein